MAYDGAPNMRPVCGERIGTTSFFRNVALLRAVVGLLRNVSRPRVLIHGCSNGAEAYSLAIAWCEAGDGPIEIDATDVEGSFLEQARGLEHPRLTPYARELVRFLPPASVVEFRSPRFYDVTMCNNVLCYLTLEEQSEAIARMADYTALCLCVTAGDPATVWRSMRAAEFKPCRRNWLRIYYGWRDRLSWGHRKTWKLPYIPFLLPHWRYAGTTLFRRSDRWSAFWLTAGCVSAAAAAIGFWAITVGAVLVATAKTEPPEPRSELLVR